MVVKEERLNATTLLQSYHCFPVIGLARFEVTWRRARFSSRVLYACHMSSRGARVEKEIGARERGVLERAVTQSRGSARGKLAASRAYHQATLSEKSSSHLSVSRRYSRENATRSRRRFHLSSKLRACPLPVLANRLCAIPRTKFLGNKIP